MQRQYFAPSIRFMQLLYGKILFVADLVICSTCGSPERPASHFRDCPGTNINGAQGGAGMKESQADEHTARVLNSLLSARCSVLRKAMKGMLKTVIYIIVYFMEEISPR